MMSITVCVSKRQRDVLPETHIPPLLSNLPVWRMAAGWCGEKLGQSLKFPHTTVASQYVAIMLFFIPLNNCFILVVVACILSFETQDDSEMWTTLIYVLA